MEKQHHKDFAGWHELKAKLDGYHKAPLFQQRDVWWTCIGANIGYEVDGKSHRFNRPVLVVRKFNERFFFGVPLTTKRKESNPYYYPLCFQDKEISALLFQARPFDAKRLTHRMGKLSNAQFSGVREALAEMVGNPATERC